MTRQVVLGAFRSLRLPRARLARGCGFPPTQPPLLGGHTTGLLLGHWLGRGFRVGPVVRASPERPLPLSDLAAWRSPRRERVGPVSWAEPWAHLQRPGRSACLGGGRTRNRSV